MVKVCVPECVLCAPRACRSPRMSEESIGSPGSEVTDGGKPPCGCWVLNPDPLHYFCFQAKGMSTRNITLV